jgi:hypothetical protein
MLAGIDPSLDRGPHKLLQLVDTRNDILARA